MSTATRFINGGAKTPRHIICFSAPGKWASRNVRRDPSTGRPLLICEADDITTCRIDLSHILEKGETIATAQDDARNCTSGITYEGATINLTVSEPHEAGLVLIDVLTTFHEQFTLRIGVRLPKKQGEDRRVSTKAYGRGSIL